MLRAIRIIFLQALRSSRVHEQSASEQGVPPAAAASLRRSPIAGLFLVVAALGAVGAVLWSARERDHVGVLVARIDIPQFHLMTARDIRVGTRDDADPARFASYPVEGRLTTRPLKRGAAIREEDLGPRPSKAMRQDLVLTGVQVTRAATLNGALRSGDRVELLAAAHGRATLEATSSLSSGA
jgi:hypothetical protein